MWLSTLEVDAIRNLQAVRVSFPRGFTLLFGENGQGKTNLLEAIHLLLTLKSFRDATNGQMLAHGASEGAITGTLSRSGLERRHHLCLRKGGRTLRLDGKAPSRLRDWFEAVAAVQFTPDDLRILDGPGATRRRFMDRAAFTLDPGMLSDALDYAGALRHRNALLRQGLESGRAPDGAVLDAFDDAVAAAGAAIVIRRILLLSALGPALREVHEGVTAAKKGRIEVRYRPCVGTEVDPQRPESVRDALRTRLVEHRATDVQRGHTGVGPHREDWDIRVGGESLKTFGSQGQLRAAALALKIALVRVVQAQRGFCPIFLLDDHSSELDANRQQGLIEVLAALRGQVVVTSTDAHVLSRHVVPEAVFHVEQGRVLG